MSHIDTLQTFEDLISAGVSEPQAKAQVHALNASFDGVVTKEYLDNKLEHLDNKFRLVYILGAAIFTVCCVPLMSKLF